MMGERSRSCLANRMPAFSRTMKYVVEELSDSEDWEDATVKASRVLGPQVPDLTKKRRLVKAYSSSPHEAINLPDTEALSRNKSPPSLQSFAFQSKAPLGAAKPAFSMLTHSTQNYVKDTHGAEFVKVTHSLKPSTAGCELEGRKRDQAGQDWRRNARAVEIATEEDNDTRNASRSVTFIRHALANTSAKVLGQKTQLVATGPEAQGSARGKRRGRRPRVVADSSDEDFECRAEKKGKLCPVAYYRELDTDDCANDESIARELQHNEDGNGSTGVMEHEIGRSEDNVYPLKKTLFKCEKIAAALRKKLHRSSDSPIIMDRYAEVDPSSAKVVTQADVCAACDTDPSDTQHALTPYQLVGVNFLLLLHREKVGGAILADEMGLGKTVQAVVYLAVLKQLDQDGGPHLIVCPASLLENWQRELNRWCPSFSVLFYHGSDRIAHSRELLAVAKYGGEFPFNVMLTSYSIFERESAQQRSDRKLMKIWRWSCVLMDEAHLLKDKHSLRAKHLRSVAKGAHHRLMLTGTPLQNDLQELWSLLEFMMPETFDTGSADLSKLLGNRKSTGGGTVENMDLIGHIKTILGPFILRRLKSDVMRQLVPKIQKVEIVGMLNEQAVAYREAVDNYRMVVAARASGTSRAGTTSMVHSLPRREVNSIFTELRKLANHPLLSRRIYKDYAVESMAKRFHQLGVFGFECSMEKVQAELSTYSDYSLHKMCVMYGDGDGYARLDKRYALCSAKCQAIAKLLPRLQQCGHRPLIFSQWTGMLDILEWALESLGFNYVRLDGSTPVLERQTLVDSYNSSKDIFAFLLSTRSGGQGLNLTGADTVILHDVDFNPQVDRQAEDRCHRIGQMKPVTVYRLVTKTTVDENIYEIAKRKLVLDAAVLESKASDEVESNCQETIRNITDILASILAVAP